MDADLNAMERSLVMTIRAARVLYSGGDEDAAKRVIHTEAVPMLVACVKYQEEGESYGNITMPIMSASNPEA